MVSEGRGVTMAETTARGAARTESAEVFVRHSSGLVREMSAGDALIGNVLILNLVIASVTLLSVPFTFPGASLPIGLLLTFIPSGLIASVYGVYSVAIPPPGGDYGCLAPT